MIYLCMVIEVIQNMTPARTMVMIPGTHPRTLEVQAKVSLDNAIFIAMPSTHERDQVCAMIAKQTWSPAKRTAVFCQDMVRSLISCW
jgi:hypothetical protein